MDIPFIKGHEYNRRLDLHGKYGGSRQSGISSCADYPMIFIFTNSSYSFFIHFAKIIVTRFNTLIASSMIKRTSIVVILKFYY